MKISKLFQLGKTQAELDFVDIDPDGDTPLFLDPHFLSKRVDSWSVEATLTLKSFFQRIIDLVRTDQIDVAKDMFDYLREPNATCLGLSQGRPRGNGVGDRDTAKIFQSLLKSRAIQTGLVQDLQDSILFVDNFGRDKLSDMATNIITKHLVDYTIRQCIFHNIPLHSGLSTGYYWSRQSNSWENSSSQRLIAGGKPILLVPKGAVSFSQSYTPDRYYQHFVLTFLQNEHLRLNSALVQRRAKGARFVTKKSLETDNPRNKDFLRSFTFKHPKVLQDFKDQTNPPPLQNSQISDVSFQTIAKSLGSQLVKIPFGTKDASAFHNIVLGILELLFYPDLMNPVKEQDIDKGRKRIDILFDNSSTSGFFFNLSNHFMLPCGHIFIECKNYSTDIANPELDQLAGRFSINRGKVGIVVCRSFDNRQLFIERCRDTYTAQRGLIIPLIDQDLVNLLDNIDENNRTFLNDYLTKILKEITL
ncbi:hypothetical protein [Mucilaginibacter aquatilis]|uniref:Uncharacterized protein n=1 Tax=Mucilaginibacter aquatilis TaxID=1517760 RepID=A0A6I4I955_9SPHI|nr:hypothetical protein [Mucilaginibacter aquatilis]MVN91477.1 hypothetical protein [Mucilaginibacter aquatilis]